MTFIRFVSKPVNPVNLTSLHEKGRALKSHVNLALNLKAGSRDLTMADIEKYVGTLHRDQDQVRAAMTTFFNWSKGKGVGDKRTVDAHELKARIDKAVGIANRFNGDGGKELEGSAAREAMRRKTVRSLDALTELSAKNAAKPLVSMKAGFIQTQSGPVTARSSFTLDYAPERIAGAPGAPVTAFVSINGAKPATYQVAVANKAGEVVATKPTVLVPPQAQAGAPKIDIWFNRQADATDSAGRASVNWDSNMSQNYPVRTS